MNIVKETDVLENNKVGTKFERSGIKGPEVTEFWLDELGFFSLKRLWSFRMRGQAQKVRYISITRFGKICLKHNVLKRFYIFEKIQYCISEMHINGEGLYWHIYGDSSRIALEIANIVLERLQVHKSLGEKYNRKKIELFYKQKIALDIRPYIKLVDILDSFTSAEDNKSARKFVIIVKQNLWLKFISNFKEHLLIETLPYPNVKEFLTLTFNLIRFPIGILVNGIFKAVSMVFEKKVKDEEKPKVAVLHAQSLDMAYRSDYFWYPESGLNSDQVLVYFRIPNKAPGPDILNLVKSHGFRSVNLIPRRLLKISGLGTPEMYLYKSFYFIKRLSSAFLEVLKLCRFLIFKGNKQLLLWQVRNLSGLLYHIALYEAFFIDYNIKIHFALHEAGEQLTASNMAAEITETVDISCHWSNYPVVYVDHGKTQDVYFSWGPHYRKFFENDFFDFKRLVYCGYSYDSYFKRRKVESEELRKKLLNQGVKHIVCFFDETYSSEANYPKRDYIEIHKKFLEELLSDPSLGIILKPKRLNYYDSDLQEVLDLINQARETKRCLFIVSDCFPSTVAQASDFAIGLGVFNTAALESALAGTPTATINSGKGEFHSFYKNGLGKIAFDDFGELFDKIKEYLVKQCCEDGFAD